MRLHVLVCCPLLATVALAQDKPAKSYPEQGRVTQVDVFVPDLPPPRVRGIPDDASSQYHPRTYNATLGCTWTFKIETGTQIFTVQGTGVYDSRSYGKIQTLPTHQTRVLCKDDLPVEARVAAISCSIIDSGGPIDFRVEGKALYTPEGKKEHKYNIAKVEPKPTGPAQ